MLGPKEKVVGDFYMHIYYIFCSQMCLSFYSKEYMPWSDWQYKSTVIFIYDCFL